MPNVFEIDESCTQCDSCGREMELDDIVLDPERGCICSKCNNAHMKQELMEAGVIDLTSHILGCMKGE